jgi:hypothetical protein
MPVTPHAYTLLHGSDPQQHASLHAQNPSSHPPASAAAHHAQFSTGGSLSQPNWPSSQIRGFVQHPAGALLPTLTAPRTSFAGFGGVTAAHPSDSHLTSGSLTHRSSLDGSGMQIMVTEKSSAREAQGASAQNPPQPTSGETGTDDQAAAAWRQKRRSKVSCCCEVYTSLWHMKYCVSNFGRDLSMLYSPAAPEQVVHLLEHESE